VHWPPSSTRVIAVSAISGTLLQRYRVWLPLPVGNRSCNHYILTGKTGVLEFDRQGDRVAAYSVKHFQNGKWEEVALAESENGKIQSSKHDLIWQGGEYIPGDEPECGFDGKRCIGM